MPSFPSLFLLPVLTAVGEESGMAEEPSWDMDKTGFRLVRVVSFDAMPVSRVTPRWSPSRLKVHAYHAEKVYIKRKRQDRSILDTWGDVAPE